MAERIVGIDFGTSSSAIRVRCYENGEALNEVPIAVTFDNGKPILPTLIVELEEGKPDYFGYDAEAMSRRKNAAIYKNFKLDLESPDEAVRSKARELTSAYLRYLGSHYEHQSEAGLLGAQNNAVKTYISYPVKWSKEARAFMIQAAEEAGFPHVEGRDEAQACIQALVRQFGPQFTKKGWFRKNAPCTILLIDMGAGTSDLVVCRYMPDQGVQYLSTWPENGEVLFGGAEVDELLYQYIKKAYPGENRIELLRKSNGDEFRIWKQKVVSPGLQREEAVDYFDALEFILGNAAFDPIDRSVFEDMAAEYLPAFPKLVNGAIEKAGLTGADIDLVILTGGHSQWYFVREMLLGKLSRFGEISLEKIRAEPERIISLDNPQETVALGLVCPNVPCVLDEDADFECGTDSYEGMDGAQNNLETAPLFLKAAERGDADAQYRLGDCYEHGNGVLRNYAEAVKWYRKAAEQGHAAAQNNLGECYYNGHGFLLRDYADAIKWYRKAAEQGYAAAQNNLGLCYYYGNGIPQDYTEAVKWYRKAAEQGHAAAQNNLGGCYRSGKGIPQDDTEAVKWYRKAAEQGHAAAQNNLGFCYRNGKGVLQNATEGVKWYRKAAEQGDADAQNNLGFCYYYGNGIPQDYTEAAKWYRKAAEQGHAVAQNVLGFCYRNGKGVPQDDVEALKWYRKMAKQGENIAKERLKENANEEKRRSGGFLGWLFR